MYLMYVDESGDSGLLKSPTKYLILSAIVVHESNWLQMLNEVIAFRRQLKIQKGLLMKEEIHSSHFASRRIKTKNNITPSNRIDILRLCLEWLSKRNYINLISVRVDKSRGGDPFEIAWKDLIQRFENTLKHQNFPNPKFKTDAGIIIADDTDVVKLRGILRKMRRINNVPNMAGAGARNMPLNFIIKDPIFRTSKDSFILQMVDVAAYFVKQYYDPNKMIKKRGGKNWYGKLVPIINQKVTYKNTPFKIIEA